MLGSEHRRVGRVLNRLDGPDAEGAVPGIRCVATNLTELTTQPTSEHSALVDDEHSVDLSDQSARRRDDDGLRRAHAPFEEPFDTDAPGEHVGTHLRSGTHTQRAADADAAVDLAVHTQVPVALDLTDDALPGDDARGRIGSRVQRVGICCPSHRATVLKTCPRS